jgi:glycerophosphoryl diester phosphodiesterase
MASKLRMALAGGALALAACAHEPSVPAPQGTIQLGPRPLFLVDDMDAGPLKERLLQCAAGPFARTDFSIAHRGAPLQFPEHTRESYLAAARMGAGIIECDVTFTRDRELVCRHAQCDLHTTTNILATPLAAKCSEPFTPFDPANIDRTTRAPYPARARCCASDLTLAEFRTLRGKMDAFDPRAQTVDEYLDATPRWRTDLYSARGTLMTHRESIELFRALGVKMIPELKAPEVAMPFEGDYTRERYAQQVIDEYERAGVQPENVFLQSFDLDDLRYWIETEPEFGRQAIYLDDRYAGSSPIDPNDTSTFVPSMQELAAAGVRLIAPPMWMLVIERDGRIVPSAYALEAAAAGLEIIPWSFERSAPLSSDGDWFYQSTDDVVDNDGDAYVTLDVLAREVGIAGIFSDWPATVTYYANCMGL